jgi:signal transduction histidine kinase
MLIHIVNNLIDNAIKYSHENGKLQISGRRDGGYWVLQVADTGIGIAKSELPRVFERVWRADRSRTRATGGTGLGLAIVKQLVTQLRGSVGLVSGEGKGSTFTVRLPVGM